MLLCYYDTTMFFMLLFHVFAVYFS